MKIETAQDLYGESSRCAILHENNLKMADENIAEHMKRIGYTWAGCLSSGTDVYYTKKRIALHFDRSGTVFFYDRRTPK